MKLIILILFSVSVKCQQLPPTMIPLGKFDTVKSQLNHADGYMVYQLCKHKFHPEMKEEWVFAYFLDIKKKRFKTRVLNSSRK